jgi:hypothetical protein
VVRLGYLWASPLTALGLLAAWAGGARRIPASVESPHELAHVGGWWARWHRLVGTGAGTCGRVVIYRDEQAARSSRLVRHEGRHVAQCMALGILWPVAYALGLVVGAARGHPYRLNPLEVDARRAAGE